DGLALLFEHDVVPPGVAVDLQRDALGDELGVVDHRADRVVVDQATGRRLVRPAARLRRVPGHQRVLQADVEHRPARVALPAGATPELVVDAAGVVPAGTDHVQAAQLGDLLGAGPVAAAEPAVGTPAGHLGGDGDRAVAAGLGDHRGLGRVVLGVEDHAFDVGGAQRVGDPLGLGHVQGADQDRAALGVGDRDLGDDRVLLGLGGGVDAVRLVHADAGAVGLDDRDFQLVELAELLADGDRGAGHA